MMMTNKGKFGRLAAWLVVLAGLLWGGPAAAETITYLHNDVAGTPLMATDAEGNVVWKETYQPFGSRLNNQAEAGSNAKWFTGKSYDPDTGLSYFGARYYDPVIGRFMGMDPAAVDAGNIQGLNRYSYGNNNPYRYVDPDGRQSEPINSDELEQYRRTFVYPGASAARTVGDTFSGPVSDGAEFAYETFTAGKLLKLMGVAFGITLKAGKDAAVAERGLWVVTKDGSERIVQHETFGKIFKSKSDGLWWAKDKAGHGESKWKVFRETSKGLEWYRDADKYGDFIVGKHKGDIGKFIPWKELRGSGS